MELENQINKTSLIATVIAVVSCKMNIEGFYKYRIKPEFIIEILDSHKLLKDVTIEEISEVSKIVFLQDYKCEKGVLKGVRCPASFINYIFNSTHIQPLHHLTQE